MVGDGYQKTELAKFRTDVGTATSTMSAKYQKHWDAFDVWTADFSSTDTGITDPGSATTTAARKDTAFSTAFGAGDLRRCVWPAPGIHLTTSIKLQLARLVTHADSTAIVANTSEYGGCASAPQRLITVTTDASSAEILAHELAHGLLYLNDEYEYGTCNVVAGNGINTGNNLANLPWKGMVNTTTLPTTAPGSIGAYVGGNYCAAGVYRPQANCLMKELAAPFCEVCSCQLERSHIARQTRDRCAQKNELPQRCKDIVKDSCDGKADGQLLQRDHPVRCVCLPRWLARRRTELPDREDVQRLRRRWRDPLRVRPGSRRLEIRPPHGRAGALTAS